MDVHAQAAKIKLLLMDVDGVLTNGKLYAFWISPETNGASHGYIAAGGPGHRGTKDTVGMKG